tara:strand:+ start:684 stop:2861 length:2178 start_codon:yes stop_codon:yes gene_type:complete
MDKRDIGLGVFGLIGIAYVVSNGMLLSDYMKKRKHKNAETFNAELKKDSCCCGATVENPCLCMEEGVMNCSAVEPKCPCYAAKEAESFEADECSLHNCENNMVCDLCDCCEEHCFCGYCDNDKCYNSGLNATNNDYTPVGVDNLCEDGFCEWCHTTKSHPNLVNQGYVASPYCECHAFNAESFEAELSHEDKATRIYEGIQQNINNPETVRFYYELFYGEPPAEDYEGDMALDVIEAVQQNLNGKEFVDYMYGEMYNAESYVACKQENCPHGHCPRCGNCDDVLDNDGDGSEDDDNPMFCGGCGESFSAESFEAECKHENWERGETIEPHYIYENGELVDEVNLYWVECNECGAIGDEFVEGEGPTRIKWDAESFEAQGKLYSPHYQNPNTNCSACGAEVHYLWSDDKALFYCHKCKGYDNEQEFIEDYSAESFADTDRKKAQVLDKIMAWHDRMQLQSDSIAYELDRMDWMLENPDKDYDDYDDYAESFGAELNQKQLEALKRIREKRNKSSKKEDETKCPCGGDIVEALVCNHCLEVHRLYGAESFEAPGEMEEEDFIPMDITQCHVCARPYEYSRIARALVQHYLKESDDGTKGWKNKSTPDGTRRTVRNIAGYQLYWYGLGALENYLEEGKISKMTPMVINLLRNAIVPNIIAGDVVQFIESMEIDDIENTDPTFFTDFSDTWEAPDDRLRPERPSDETGDSRKDRKKPRKPWSAENQPSE